MTCFFFLLSPIPSSSQAAALEDLFWVSQILLYQNESVKLILYHDYLKNVFYSLILDLSARQPPLPSPQSGVSRIPGKFLLQSSGVTEATGSISGNTEKQQ